MYEQEKPGISMVFTTLSTANVGYEKGSVPTVQRMFDIPTWNNYLSKQDIFLTVIIITVVLSSSWVVFYEGWPYDIHSKTFYLRINQFVNRNKNQSNSLPCPNPHIPATALKYEIWVDLDHKKKAIYLTIILKIEIRTNLTVYPAPTTHTSNSLTQEKLQHE